MTELWDLMRGAMATKALGVAGDLRIADELATGPRPVAQLAEATGADADTLHRILRALASEGVFAEDEPGVFRNTDASERLRHEDSRAFAHQFATVYYEALETLDPRLSGETFSHKFGTDFWAWLKARPVERAAFDVSMAGGKERSAERLAALEWRQGEVVVDVGGGNGALLRALIARRPELDGIVFDLPETDRDDAALGEGIRFVPGSFFESVPTGDTYVLSGVLTDWNDEPAAAILRTIRAAAREYGRLLVLDTVLAPGNDPHGGKWLDLLMLVIGGRHRTEQDWRALLEGADFSPTSIEDGLIQARCR